MLFIYLFIYFISIESVLYLIKIQWSLDLIISRIRIVPYYFCIVMQAENIVSSCKESCNNKKKLCKDIAQRIRRPFANLALFIYFKGSVCK